jgi:hypothetical protein
VPTTEAIREDQAAKEKKQRKGRKMEGEEQMSLGKAACFEVLRWGGCKPMHLSFRRFKSCGQECDAGA